MLAIGIALRFNIVRLYRCYGENFVLEGSWYWLPPVFVRSLCGIYSEFVRQMIQDAYLVLFTCIAVCSTVGFSFVNFVFQHSPLLHVHVAAFVLVFRGCGYVRSKANHSSVLTYDKIVIYIPSSNLHFCGYEVIMMKPMV